MRWSAALLAFALLGATNALAQSGAPQAPMPLPVDDRGCQDVTYDVVVSPDGETLSILFDNMSVSGAPDGRRVQAACSLQIPLPLAPGYSLGVYKVDYRGFARLSTRQIAELKIDYGFGAASGGLQFQRNIIGPIEDDYLFSETIGAGLMSRVGCGSRAKLTLNATLTLNSGRATGESLVTLDSVDGSRQGAITFYLERKKCTGFRRRQ